MIITIFGTIAAILQGLGYWWYNKKHTQHQTDPNPYTWLMFAYGTFLLTLLELDTLIVEFGRLNWIGAALLLLPIVCSFGAIWIFWKIYRKNKIERIRSIFWPSDRTDQFSLLMDLAITFAYVACWALLFWALISEQARDNVAWWALFFANASAVPGFIPMYRAILKGEEIEYTAPWTIWGLAYAALTVATFIKVETLWHALMFYPLANTVLHLLVAIMVVYARKRQHSVYA